MRLAPVRFAVALAMLAYSGIAGAGQDKNVSASAGWVKLPAAGDTQALAFVTVANPTMYGVYVTRAAADVAGKIELRDRGQNTPLEFITVPAYERVTMGPDGVYLLLRDLKRPLKEGDAVTLTLSTDIDVTLKIAAVVKKE